MQHSFTKSTLKKIESIFCTLGYTVRYEKGQFNSGYCMVQNRNIVVVNKFFEIKERIKTLKAVLSTITIPTDVGFDEKTTKFLKSIRSKDLFSQPAVTSS